MYRPLQLAHEAAAACMGALPLRRRWWHRPDTAAVLSFGVPFALVLVGTLYARATLGALPVAGALASFVLLLCLLRQPQLFSNRHAVVSSSLLAALRTFTAAALLQP